MTEDNWKATMAAREMVQKSPWMLGEPIDEQWVVGIVAAAWALPARPQPAAGDVEAMALMQKLNEALDCLAEYADAPGFVWRQVRQAQTSATTVLGNLAARPPTLADVPVEATDMLRLARSIEQAYLVEVHNGDREPGSGLTNVGIKWVAAGLRLLASGAVSPPDTHPVHVVGYLPAAGPTQGHPGHGASMDGVAVGTLADVPAGEREAIRDISRQKLIAEMSGDDYRNADFESAYEQMIEVARAALDRLTAA
jgi:hypothetical protein